MRILRKETKGTKVERKQALHEETERTEKSDNMKRQMILTLEDNPSACANLSWRGACEFETGTVAHSHYQRYVSSCRPDGGIFHLQKKYITSFFSGFGPSDAANE